MAQLAKHHELVGKTYDTSGLVTYGFDFEMERLEKHNPVEYAITQRYLQRYIKDGLTIVDVGVGVGHYSELLARRGCKVYLVDVAERLLEAARERLTKAGLEQQILGVHHTSATDLSMLSDACCDVVLLLGPLYHLSIPEERRQALAEARRVLRKDGLLFAAAINRMTILRYSYCGELDAEAETREWLERYTQTGCLEAEEPDIPAPVYLATIEDFRAEFTGFQQLVLAGVESFATYHEDLLLKMPPERAQIWLDLIEQTGRRLEGLGMAGHFLYIGRKLPDEKER